MFVIKTYINFKEEKFVVLITKFVVLNMGRRPFLPPALEEEFVNYCLQMESYYYAVTTSDLKRITFQLTMRNNVPHPFLHTENKAKRARNGCN